MYQNSKRVMVLFLITSFLISVIVYIFILNHRKDIDFSDKSLNFTTYNDYKYIDSSNSRIIESGFNEKRAFISFKLADNRLYPYTGFFLEPDNEELISIVSYGQVEIEVNSFVSTDFTFFINTFEEGYTRIEDPTTYRLVTKNIEVKKGRSVYRFGIDDITTPDWWYNERGMKEDDITGKPDLSRIIQVGVQNHPYAPKDSIITIEINAISFTQNALKWAIIIFSLFMLALPLAYLLIFHGIKPPIPDPQRMENADGPSDLKIIEDYINDNFRKDDLNISDINSETGIPLSRIRKELQKGYKRTFKQYLTELRLKDAKRLLLETDKKIFEIANLSGYRHVTTLNRLFKEAEGISPLEYRKKYQQNNLIMPVNFEKP